MAITFPAAVGQAIRSVQCALLNDNEYVVSSVGRFAGPVRERALDGINATRGLLGCPGDPVPPPDPEFTGGQCEGVLYTVNVSYRGSNNQIQTTLTQSFRGPVRGLFPRPPNEFNSVAVFLESGFPSQIPVQMFNTSPANANTGQITAITRQGGLPDNCGSPPPVYPPPTSISRDVDVTYNIDNGDEVTVTVPFVFAPITVDLNGNFRIPVTFDFGGNQFSASFPLDLSFPVTINFPGLNPGDGQGIEGEPPDGPGETFPPATPDQKIIGVVVTATEIDDLAASSYQLPQLTPIYVPRLGSVKFVYSLGGATFFSSDIDVKDRRTFIECPYVGGADAVIASPQTGVSFSFLPIRGFPVATTGDLSTSS